MEQSSFNVLVAEDEKLLLDNLVKKIESLNLGFKVIGKAQTGIQAYDLVKQNSPDLIITDIKMPVMNGIDLLKKVYLHYPFIKFIIISGFSDFEYAKSAIQLEVVEYLLKPIDTEDLKNGLLKVKQKLIIEQETFDDISDNVFRNSPEQIADLLKDYLVANYNVDINLNIVANNMNYSCGYLTKIFLQQYNTTPSKYITDLRISKAKHTLLHNRQLPIREIGEMVGYEDQGYFSRIFKKKVGLSPFKYREKH